MDHQPGSPPASAPSATAGGGDVVAVLVRSWLDLAAETMPGDAALAELLTSRLLTLAGRRTAPTEAELLDVAEEAAQHAVGKGSPDAARLLSKRLRRAIYEYLLSLDAVTQGPAGSSRVLTGAGADDALTATAVAARRSRERPELIWDEPALRVLEGGARTRPAFAELDAGVDLDDDAPVVHAPAAPPPDEAGPDGEQDELEEADEAAAVAPLADSPGAASAAGEALPAAPDEPAVLPAMPLEAEALRVPERFRRDEPAPSTGPIDGVPFAAEDPGEEPWDSVSPAAAPAPPPPPAAPGPRGVPAPRAVVVPSYRAWADVLASDEPPWVEPQAAAPTAAPRPTPAQPVPPPAPQWPASVPVSSVTPAPEHRSIPSRSDAAAAPAVVPPAPADVPPPPPAAPYPTPPPVIEEPLPAVARAVEAGPQMQPEEPPTVGAALPSLAAPAPAVPGNPFQLRTRDEEPATAEPAAEPPAMPAAPAPPAVPSPQPWAVRAPVPADPPPFQPAPAPPPRPAAPPIASTPPAVPAWSLRDRDAERDGLPRVRATHDAPPPAVEPPPALADEEQPRWNVRSSWLGAPAESVRAEPAESGWSSAEASAPQDDTAGRWPMAAHSSPPPTAAADPAPPVDQAADAAPGSWPAMPPSPSWMAGGPAWPTAAPPATSGAPRGDTAPSGGYAVGPEDMEARIRRAADSGDPDGPAWSIRRSPRQQALQQRMAQRRREDVIRAAAAAFDEGALATRRRDKLPPIELATLPEELAELLRRKKNGEAASLVQRAAQEIGGREIADLAIECGDRCSDRKQSRAAINSYLAAWRADPLYELPLWRLAEGCLSDRETELAVGYLERIADLMRARGDDDGALDVYRKLITIAPERGDIRTLVQTVQSIGRFPD